MDVVKRETFDAARFFNKPIPERTAGVRKNMSAPVAHDGLRQAAQKETAASVKNLASRFSSGEAFQKEQSNNNSVASLKGRFEKTTISPKAQSPVVLQKKSAKETVLFSHAGATEMSKHSLDAQEEAHFIAHIQDALADDPFLKDRLAQLNETFYAELRDGIVLAKLINHAAIDTIDERAINFPTERSPRLSVFKEHENLQIVVNSAKAIGCSIVNVGADDIYAANKHIVLGLVWQLVRIDLLASINLRCHPELIRLFDGDGDDELQRLLSEGLEAEALLLRWLNYHVRKSGLGAEIGEVRNFSTDLADCRAFLTLLHQLSQRSIPLNVVRSASNEERARAVLQVAEELSVAKFITVDSLLAANPRLNMAFTANLFQQMTGLDPLTSKERMGLLADEDESQESQSRECRAFTFWINNLGIPDLNIRNLFVDGCDGIAFCKVIDRIVPGLVNFSLVHGVTDAASATSRFKKIENANYVVNLCKKIGLSVVGIQGNDIVEGNRKFILAITWQLMREHITRTLCPQDGRKLSDAELLSWANETAGSEVDRIASFKDKSLNDSRFFMALMRSIAGQDCIRDEYVSRERTPEALKSNARYALTVARKIGAVLFLTPEDIVDVNSKMILTFIGSLMMLQRQRVSKSPK